MKIAVIGGGAAGLMAAAVASAKHNVTLFEKLGRVGKKLYAAGNGKCNISNAVLTRANAEKFDAYYNCHEAAEIVAGFDYDDFMSFCADELGLETIVDEEGRVYPRSENSGSVLDALRLKCHHNGVKISLENSIMRVEKSSKGFKVWQGDGQFVFFDKVVFCVGSGMQVRNFTSFDVLRDFSIAVTKTQPSLTPIKTKKVWLPLNGSRVRAKTVLLADGRPVAEENGEVLFRDYGLSGICIFNLSAIIARNIVAGKTAQYQIALDLFPEYSVQQLFEKFCKRLAVVGKDAQTFFVGLLSNKLAEAIIGHCRFNEKLSKEDVKRLAAYCKNIVFDVDGLCGADKGQVMAGGVDFACLDGDLQCKTVSGLYFAGECIYADGLCGGFNLHFAFASGYIVGKSL